MQHKRAIPAHEPDIYRAAEGVSRPASAAVAGAVDARVRARHRTWRRYDGREFRPRTEIVRGTVEEARPRTDDPARMLFRPLEPFLVDSNFPTRPGQIRRASLLPVWQWLIREGAPEQAREFEAALARVKETGTASALESAIRKLQLATADAIFKIAAPMAGGGDKQRALARIGPPAVIEDLLPIGSVLQAREALDTLNGRLPSFLRVFAESQIASIGPSLNVAPLQTPQLLPFALSLVMQRLSAPWQIIRLAIKMAASDDEIRVAATSYGIAVTIALHDLSCLARACALISGAASSIMSASI